MVYIFTVHCEYLYMCVLTIKTNEKCFCICIKGWSKSVCLQEEHHMHKATLSQPDLIQMFFISYEGNLSNLQQ